MMEMVFLNDSLLPIEQAKLSPLDRGFLFGDGIYEVVPYIGGSFVGLDLHIERMIKGLDEIGYALNSRRHSIIQVKTDNDNRHYLTGGLQHVTFPRKRGLNTSKPGKHQI